MNEQLKGVKKGNQIFYIQPKDKSIDFDEITRKGYVNWPLAADYSAEFHSTVTHLPTGLSAWTLKKADTYTEVKRYIDLLVDTLGEHKLVNIVDLVEAQKTAQEIVNAYLPKIDPEPIPRVLLVNPYVTKSPQCVWFADEIKRKIPKKIFIGDLAENHIVVDGKTLRKTLVPFNKDYVVEFSIEESHMLEDWVVRWDYYKQAYITRSENRGNFRVLKAVITKTRNQWGQRGQYKNTIYLKEKE